MFVFFLHQGNEKSVSLKFEEQDVGFRLKSSRIDFKLFKNLNKNTWTAEWRSGSVLGS